MTSSLRRLVLLVAALPTRSASAATCSSVSDSDCGAGFVSKPGSASNSCYGGDVCQVGYPGASDQSQCCEDRSSTCSGVGVTKGLGFCFCAPKYVGQPIFSGGAWSNPCKATCGAKPVTDADCGDGYTAPSFKTGHPCVGSGTLATKQPRTRSLDDARCLHVRYLSSTLIHLSTTPHSISVYRWFGGRDRPGGMLRRYTHTAAIPCAHPRSDATAISVTKRAADTCAMGYLFAHLRAHLRANACADAGADA